MRLLPLFYTIIQGSQAGGGHPGKLKGKNIFLISPASRSGGGGGGGGEEVDRLLLLPQETLKKPSEKKLGNAGD